MPRRWLAVAVVILIGLTAGCTGTQATTVPAIQVYAPADRKAAPPVIGDLLDGSGSFDLAQHRGEVVVLNFWASWCAPCVAEADDLEATYQATRGEKVTFLGVNTRDERDAAKAFLVGRATYPSVFDPNGQTALGFAVPPTSIPSTIIIDRDGRIAATTFGSVIRTDLEPVVKRLAAS